MISTIKYWQTRLFANAKTIDNGMQFICSFKHKFWVTFIKWGDMLCYIVNPLLCFKLKKLGTIIAEVGYNNV